MLYLFYQETEILKVVYLHMTKANYLASPPLVVAYALAGHMEIDLYKDSLGKDKNGKDIFMKDIWPTNMEIEKL